MSVNSSIEEAKDAAVDAAEKAADSDWLERMARLGLVMRGVLYLVVATLAVQVATGEHEERADKQGALHAIARQPLGRLLMLVLAAGFAGYALWRLVEAVTGPPDEDDARKAAAKRLLYLARAGLYALFFASAVKLVIWPDGDPAADTTNADWTARILNWPGGTWLVRAAGAVVIGAALWIGWRGVSCKFRERLEAAKISRAERPLVTAVGMVGMFARTVVVGIIGLFLIMAANAHRPDEVVGIDGALKRLADRPFGPALLVTVAAGLAAYGLFSFAEARYRRIGES